jgi:hypothetical protein
MRSAILTTLIFFTFSCFINAQNNSSKKESSSNSKTSFIAEAGGPGIAFSANFDTRFKASRIGLGGRIGVGFVSAYDDYYDPVTMTYFGGDQQSAITFPVQVNYIFGKPNSAHTLEVGGGATYEFLRLL